MEFALIAKIVIAIFMIFSGLSYFWKRSDNKQNLEEAIANTESIRQLTDEEFKLLKPYLENKSLVKPYKYQSSLISKDVSVIMGACVRHSLSTNGSESSYYYMIGNIEVFLPYSMQNFTMSDNVAQVVFTQRYAFVVNLNGYSLVDAKENINIRSELKKRWNSGAAGEYKVASSSDLNDEQNRIHEDDSNVELENNKKNHCIILEQRDESTFEKMRKSNRNSGFLAAIASVISVFLLLSYSGGGDFGLLLLGGIFCVATVILYFHKPSRAPQKVNRVKGTVEHKYTNSNSLLIGNSLMLSYPQHWASILPEVTTNDADMSATVDSKELIRYGYALSIDKEIEKNGPAKFWGRNCLLFVVGIILCGYVLFSTPSLGDDFAFTRNWVTNQFTVFKVNNLPELREAKIKKGDWVELNLNGATCDSSSSQHKCSKIFFNDAVVNLDDVVEPLPEWVKKVLNNSLVITHRDAQVELLEKIHNANNNSNNPYGDYYNYNQKRASYIKLLNVNALVLDANEACSTQYHSCDQLKNILAVLTSDDNNNKLGDWDVIVNYAKEKPSKVIITSRAATNEVSKIFSSLTSNFFGTRESILRKQLMNLQQADESIELNLMNGYLADVNIDIDSASYGRNHNTQKSAYYEQFLTTAKGYMSIDGIVSNVKYREDGTVKSLDINHNKRYNFSTASTKPSAALTLLIFCVIAVLTFFQGLIWLYKIYFNKQRMDRILNEYKHMIL